MSRLNLFAALLLAGGLTAGLVWAGAPPEPGPVQSAPPRPAPKVGPPTLKGSWVGEIVSPDGKSRRDMALLVDDTHADWAITQSAPGVQVAAAPVPKEKAKPLYLPVAVGAKRVLALTYDGKTAEVAEVVTRVEEKDGVYTVTVEDQTDGARPAASVYEVSETGLVWRHDGKADPLVKAGARPGETWETTAEQGGREVKTTHTLGAEEAVEVPAGTFRAVRVDMESASGDQAVLKTTAWYAPGVGVVKSVTTGIFTSGTELKSFTPGKG